MPILAYLFLFCLFSGFWAVDGQDFCKIWNKDLSASAGHRSANFQPLLVLLCRKDCPKEFFSCQARQKWLQKAPTPPKFAPSQLWHTHREKIIGWEDSLSSLSLLLGDEKNSLNSALEAVLFKTIFGLSPITVKDLRAMSFPVWPTRQIFVLQISIEKCFGGSQPLTAGGAGGILFPLSTLKTEKVRQIPAHFCRQLSFRFSPLSFFVLVRLGTNNREDKFHFQARLSAGVFNRFSVIYSKNILSPETPEFCCGKILAWTFLAWLFWTFCVAKSGWFGGHVVLL